ncbi:GDP-mannose 4,6-dehydratase [Patescibacteria group bacterium]|nr:GDP-mannose 4,6-dehydratase [Patescibacteria group bacterium]
MAKEQKFYPGEKKNILITGGAGFLGSHLCNQLIKENNVICLDNLIGERDINNIKPLLQNPGFQFIKHDINLPIDFKQFPELKKFKIDIQGITEIYHLACPTSAKNFDQLRIQTLYANSIGIINILELAKFYKAKMLFTSSSVVYGGRKDDQSSFKESDFGSVNFTSPRACYDEGKRFAETSIITMAEMYNLDAKIVRIFRTYGPRQALFDGQMVPDFVLQALNDKPLIIYGDDSFSTSLCYVDDILEGMLKVMDSSEKGPINLGGETSHTLVDLGKKIIEFTGSKSKIEFRPALEFMTPLGLPDITLAKEKLDWFPVTNLETGLKKLIDYVKANRILLQPLINKYDQE